MKLKKDKPETSGNVAASNDFTDQKKEFEKIEERAFFFPREGETLKAVSQEEAQKKLAERKEAVKAVIQQ